MNSTHPDDLLADIINLQGDVNTLRAQLAGAQGPSGWDFRYLHADQADFSQPPLEFARVRRLTQDTSVASGTTHNIAFNEIHMNTGLVRFSTVSGESTRIYFPSANANKKAVLYTGKIEYDNVASTLGTRIVYLKLWKPDGTLNGTFTLARTQSGKSPDFLSQTFSHVGRITSSITAVSLAVIQDSGSSVTLTVAYLSMLRVF